MVMAGTGPLAEFLTARRHQIQPEQVGLPRERGRRVAGLRRSEVAELAGISVDYYLRLEQGRDRQPSAQVLAAISRAFGLDPVAETYLHRIVQRSGGQARSGPPRPSTDPAMVVKTWGSTPAYISDAHLDIVAVNPAGEVLAPGYLRPGHNLLTDVFAVSSSAYDDADWYETARRLVAALRYHADPTSPRLHQLLGALSVEHRIFRQLWSLHEAIPLTSGHALHSIPGHGWVDLHWLTLDLPGDVGQFVTTFSADPGSPGEAALREVGQRAAGRSGADSTSTASSSSLPSASLSAGRSTSSASS
jgi:transcriptional regulator with XRE-family HTH domain